MNNKKEEKKIITKTIKLDEKIILKLMENEEDKNFSKVIKKLIQNKIDDNFKNEKEKQKEKNIILKEINNLKFNQNLILNMLNSISHKIFDDNIYYGDRLSNLSLNFSKSLELEQEKFEEFLKQKREMKKV